MTQTERRGDRSRRQHLRRVEQSDGKPVAQIGPARLAHQVEAQPFPLGESLFARDDQQRGVDQRQKADSQLRRHRSSPAAMTTECATSAILRFSFIAVRRSSA